MTSVKSTIPMAPYEFYIDISYNYPYNNTVTNIKCVCKDILIHSLNEIKNIENLDKYNVYICGKINSSDSFPTWDCDLTIENNEYNENELIEICKQIKQKGLDNNLNFDLKFMRDIDLWNNCVPNPDEYFEIVQANFYCDPSNNMFSVKERNRKMRIRKTKNQFFTYYNALLIKKKGEIEFEQEAINFINNSNLPNSSLRNSGLFNDRYSFKK